jgi:hypothetical protein
VAVRDPMCGSLGHICFSERCNEVFSTSLSYLYKPLKRSGNYVYHMLKKSVTVKFVLRVS